MKQKLSIILVILLSFTLGETHVYATESDVTEVQQLIDTGNSITDGSSAAAFVWISNVLSFIEKHKDSYVYKDIKNEATSAKNYTSISTANKQNIILGYLDYLKDELNAVNNKDVDELISEGSSISKSNSSYAYKWLIEVNKTVEQYVKYNVSSDIIDEVNSAKNYTSISTANKQNIILGYLGYLEDILNGVNDKSVKDILNEANKINVYNSSNAYKWLLEVENVVEKYNEYAVSLEIKDEVKSAKNYTSVSTANKFNIIVGYVSFLEEKIESSGIVTADKINILISEAQNISNWSSSKAYKWLMEVCEFNQVFYDTTVHNSLEEHCNSAKNYSSISTANYNNIILADLMLLEQELPESIVFEGIEISTPPNKIVYNDGDLFNPAGMSVNAVYTYIYSDESTAEKNKAITDYVVDTTTPLSCDDEEWIISYTEGEVTKTAKQQITVKPVLISETLKSIEIAKAPNKTVYKEGEIFSKNGMRIDAIYDQEWSDGTSYSARKENVPFTVDTKTKLKASDTSVTVVVTDGDVKLSLEQGITVESYITSTTLESITVAKKPNKLTYNAGERFDKTGMVINAKYKCVWSNGYTEYVEKENIENYSVNTTSPLIPGTNKIIVTFIDNGIKKTADISITVVSQYKNEWINGKWYDETGSSTYDGVLSWKSDTTGWWVEDSAGWYPKSEWQKIDGKWYYFCADGYMDYSEYRDGCWLNADGSMDPNYTGGHWCCDMNGWWYEDNGWYPCSQYVWIDGVHYWFGNDGYWR